MPKRPAPPVATTPEPRRQSNISFTGTSGKPYRFQVWPMETRFKPMAAVYFVTKRAYSNRTYNTASHDAIFIGQTDNLAGAFGTTAPSACFLKHEANCVCVHPLADAEQRIAVVKDLLGVHSTHCNDEGRSKPLIAVSDA